MLEVIKYGTSKYGIWVIGHLKFQDLEIIDIFNTNIKDENYFKDNLSAKPKKIKISKNKAKQIVFTLEF